MNKPPAQKVNGLIDGLAALQELALMERPISCLELSNKLNISHVRANRLLKTLAYLGFAYRSSSRKYEVGPAMHILSAQSMRASGLLKKLFHDLESLGASGKTVALGVLWKGDVCYLYHRNPGADLIDGIAGAPLRPSFDSSIGMALLAKLTDENIRSLCPQERINYILESVREIREKGYAVIEYSDHKSLAVKIGDPAYAAIAVSNIKNHDEFVFFLNKLKSIVRQL